MTAELESTPILTGDDPRLGEWCAPWRFGVDPDPHALAELLNRTMRKAGGVGLAAPQIGVMRRVFCVALGEAAGLVCFNPRIVARLGGQVWQDREGCLSFPGVFIRTRRYEGVRVAFSTCGNAQIERDLWGREAHAFQHELDHLDGRTLPDMVPPQAWARARAGAVA